MTSMVDREKQMEALQAEIENDFKLLGATGIEDKLQDEVGMEFVPYFRAYLTLRIYN